MYKKAGIIVGVLLVIAAIAIYLIVSSIMNNSEEPEGSVSSDTTSQVVETVATQATTTSTQEQSVPVQTSPIVPIETTTTEPEPVQPAPSGDNIILLDADKLPAYTDTEDVGTIVGHNVYFYKGQVIFSLLINTTTNGQIEYFTSLRNYQLEEGTRLNCELRVYSSTSGTYPSIIGITAI